MTTSSVMSDVRHRLDLLYQARDAMRDMLRVARPDTDPQVIAQINKVNDQYLVKIIELLNKR